MIYGTFDLLSRPAKYPVSLAIKLFADSTSTTDWAMFAMSSVAAACVLYFPRFQ